MLETISSSQAKDKIQSLIEETAQSHRPILITAENNNAVLLSEDDWNALQETLYLFSTPGLRESVIEKLNAPDGEFLTENEFLAELEREEKN